jgi:hypothetical protein
MFRNLLRSIYLSSVTVSLLLNACALLPGSSATSTPLPTPTPALVFSEALVESVDILMLESFPVQIEALVKGSLPDGCTTIDEITPARKDNIFEVKITTKRPADAVCTLALVPFEERIPLDVAGLKAGVYLVSVNGITNSFELSTDNVSFSTPEPGATTSGEAVVESVELIMLESFPVQVQAVAKGYMPDGCTSIDQITQTQQGNVFEVKITTKRPADAMCTQALVPFEERVALKVVGLKAGAYTVNVNGVKSTFEFTVDNVLP